MKIDSKTMNEIAWVVSSRARAVGARLIADDGLVFHRQLTTDDLWFVVETEHGRSPAMVSKLEILETPDWYGVIDIADRAIARAIDSIRPLTAIVDRDPGDEDEAEAAA